jgi:hypothetical protein
LPLTCILPLFTKLDKEHVFSKGSKLAGIICFAFLEALSVLLTAFVFFYRSNRFVKAADINFLYIMSAGICLSYANFLLQFFDGSDAKCTSEDIIFHVAFSIAFGSLIIKTWV